MRPFPLAFLASLALSLTASAQGPFGSDTIRFDLQRRALPHRPFVSQVELVDLDSDGALDLLWRTNTALEAFRSTGAGFGRSAFESFVVDAYLDGEFAVFDADQDGDQDVVVARIGQCSPGCVDAQTRLFADTPSGFLELTGLLPAAPNEPHATIDVGDYDGDGRLDLLLGGTEVTGTDPFGGTFTNVTPTVLWRNLGGLQFQDLGPVGLPDQVWTVHGLADFDGDGKDDFFGASGSAVLGIHRNGGATGFTLDAGALVGVPSAFWRVGDATAFDADGDGDLDLFASYYGSGQQVAPVLFFNDGTGVLTATAAGLGGFVGEFHALGDLDGDGDDDAVVCGVFEARAFLNDGTGQFAAGPLVKGYRPSSVLAIADVDGDGDGDLVLGSELYLGDGTGRLVNVTDGVPPTIASRRVAELLDVDGDGDLDAVVGNRDSAFNELLRNDGAGRFVRGGAGVFGPQASVLHLAAGDVDGDGLDDLAVAYGIVGQDARVHLAGGGSFASTVVLPGSDASRAIALGDVDADGSLDVVVGTLGATDRLHLGDGAGGFSFVTGAFAASTTAPYDLLLADLDGDGDADLCDGNHLYAYAGGAFAAQAAYPVVTDDVRAVRAADRDLDGDLDLMLGTDSLGSPRDNRLFVNDGLGGFTDASLDLEDRSRATQDVYFGDLDEDGDPDAVWSDRGGTAVLENVGGTFQVVAQCGALDLLTDQAPAGDLDGDGDVDLFNVSLLGEDVLFGSSRQLNAVGGARIGKDLRLELSGPAGMLSWIFWSPNEVALPVGELGVLRLDPQATFYVDFSTTGDDVLEVPIPADPALVGATYHTQGVTWTIAGLGFVKRFSNRETLPVTDL